MRQWAAGGRRGSTRPEAACAAGAQAQLCVGTPAAGRASCRPLLTPHSACTRAAYTRAQAAAGGRPRGKHPVVAHSAGSPPAACSTSCLRSQIRSETRVSASPAPAAAAATRRPPQPLSSRSPGRHVVPVGVSIILTPTAASSSRTASAAAKSLAARASARAAMRPATCICVQLRVGEWVGVRTGKVLWRRAPLRARRRAPPPVFVGVLACCWRVCRGNEPARARARVTRREITLRN